MSWIGAGSVPPRWQGPFCPNSCYFGTPPPPRRGGPMCPPGHASSRDPFTGRHIGRPLQSRLQYPSIPGQRAGTEPRPYSRQIPSAGSRYARPSSPPSPTRQSVRNDSGHQSLHLPSPVPTSPVSAQRSTRARFPEIPRKLQDGFQRKGRSPSRHNLTSLKCVRSKIAICLFSRPKRLAASRSVKIRMLSK